MEKKGRDFALEKKTLFIIVIIVVIIVILAGFFASLSEPGVEVAGIRFKSVSLSQLSISFYVTLDVDNSNPIGGKLTGVDANVYIDGQFIGTSYSEREFDIDANAVSEVEVVLDVTSVPLGLLTKNSVEVEVEGTTYLKVSFLDFEVPFDETRTVNMGSGV